MFVCSFIIALRIKIRGRYFNIALRTSVDMADGIHGRYFNIALRTSVDMADGCVDIVLSFKRAMNVLFFGTQVLPKNRGACVDTQI
jgi:hypothetical protein